MKRTHNCSELTAKSAKKEVVLMGWVNTRRDHGGVIFIDLRDREGLTQVVFNPEFHKEVHAQAEHLRREDVIAVERFGQLYAYLNLLNNSDKLDAFRKQHPNDPLFDIDSDSFKAINLIGRRQFVLIGQASSNRLEQRIALDIGLGSNIKVEVFPATYVHDLRAVLPRALPTT